MPVQADPSYRAGPTPVSQLRWPLGPGLSLPADQPPLLLPVIHFEEEFDWSVFDPAARTVDHLEDVTRAHALFAGNKIPALYCMDNPVAESATVQERLGNWLSDQSAMIGTHLHPWVSEPDADITEIKDSYPGNLPPAMEAAKLAHLTDLIDRNFGKRPIAYLAGRYGFGPATASALVDLGYQIDFSPAPAYDYRPDGGPDFLDLGCAPFWNDREPALLHVPHTGGYLGYLTRGGQRLVKPAQDSFLDGWAARLRAAGRHRLSPESRPFSILRKQTEALHAAGMRIFVLAFHSASLKPGGTPYAPNSAACEEIFARLDAYLAWFTKRFGGRGTSLEELYGLAKAATGP